MDEKQAFMKEFQPVFNCYKPAVDVSDKPKTFPPKVAIPTIGVKYDTEKPRWDLLDPAFMEDVVKVLTLGSKKYADNNWKHVEPYRDRYYAAAMRHITTWRKGEVLDDESGLPHLAHATCCLFFMWWKDKHGKGRADD